MLSLWFLFFLIGMWLCVLALLSIVVRTAPYASTLHYQINAICVNSRKRWIESILSSIIFSVSRCRLSFGKMQNNLFGTGIATKLTIRNAKVSIFVVITNSQNQNLISRNSNEKSKNEIQFDMKNGSQKGCEQTTPKKPNSNSSIQWPCAQFFLKELYVFCPLHLCIAKIMSHLCVNVSDGGGNLKTAIFPDVYQFVQRANVCVCVYDLNKIRK